MIEQGVYLGLFAKGGLRRIISDFEGFADWSESGGYRGYARSAYEQAAYEVRFLENQKEVREKLGDSKYEGVNILLAYYDYGDYSGNAFVLFKRGGQYFEVNGGHCSCYGLEGQWSPEETTLEALEHRMTKGELGRTSKWDGNKNLFAEELAHVIARERSATR